MCPYHGWQYRADGICALIPQLADPTRIPGKARVAAYRCREAFGLIWVAIDEPRWDLPEVPELDSAGLDHGAVRPVQRGRPTRRASWRTSPTSATSRGCIRACSATPSGRSCPTTRSAPTATCSVRHRPARGAQQRRLPGVRQRGRRHARAPQPLPAAAAVHDRAPPRLGRRGGDGLLLRVAADRRGPVRRLRRDRSQLRSRPAARGAAGVRAHDLRTGPARGRVPAARAGAVRPRRRDAPEVRRGRDQLPPGDA